MSTGLGLQKQATLWEPMKLGRLSIKKLQEEVGVGTGLRSTFCKNWRPAIDMIIQSSSVLPMRVCFNVIFKLIECKHT